MIVCAIHIELIQRPGGQCGFSLGFIPRIIEPHRAELQAWPLFEMMLNAAAKRIQQQMAENSTSSEEVRAFNTPHGYDVINARLKAIGGKRMPGSFSVKWGENGLLYTVVRERKEGHVIEEQAWATVKKALDVGTDFMRAPEFDAGFLPLILERSLSKLPVFPKIQPPTQPT